MTRLAGAPAQQAQTPGFAGNDSEANQNDRAVAQVHALGYTRAGQTCRTADGCGDAFGSVGMWKAAAPLFSFMVTPQLPAAVGTHCIARSSADFERLHALMLQDSTGGADADLPKLPGRKRFNANGHAHLLKRVGRYAEYLRMLLQAPAASGGTALDALESFLAQSAGEPPWHPATYVPGADLLLRQHWPGKSLAAPSDTPDDEDVRRVRVLLAQQQRSQKDMTQLMQRLLWHTCFDPSARILTSLVTSLEIP